MDDQVRLRANLKEMPATAEAYKRYLKKFDDQETQIEDFQKKIKKLQDAEFNAARSSSTTTSPSSMWNEERGAIRRVEGRLPRSRPS